MANPLTSVNAIETDRMPPELPTRVTSEDAGARSGHGAPRADGRVAVASLGNDFCVDCYNRYGKSPLKRVDQGASSFVGNNRLEGKEWLLG